MKSIFLLIIVALMSVNAFAQSLNDYKYVLVPSRYSWLNKADKYQINSLTTFLFNKYGFEAIQKGNPLPSDFNKNGCNALTADVIKVDSFLKIKLKISLINCQGDILFTSEEGVSNKKDYKWAYREALREVFYFIEKLNYKYKEGNIYVDSNKTDNKESATSLDSSISFAQGHIRKSDLIGLEGNKYRSQDGSYSLDIEEQSLVFYSGMKVIGSIIPKKETFEYSIKTKEFFGKGYFKDNVFIVEREIKGVQGVIKMIFVKQ